MGKDLEKIFDDCIGELRNGGSIELILQKYPEHKSELKPLLELVQAMEQLPKPEPTAGAVSAALIGLGEEIAHLRSAESPKIKKRRRSVFGRFFQQPRLAWTLSVAFALVLMFVGISTVSANSVPGDILYPLKLATEKVSFLLAFGSERKAELRLTFSEQRTKEIKRVLQKSGKLDEGLLNAMLKEAQLALEESPNDTSAFFLAKLNAVNTYQKDVLESFRPRVDSANEKIVNRAIGVCDMRGRWIKGMMREEWDEMPTHRPPATHQERRHSQKPQWGPGCDWMR
ncbi:MAG: DUF5667 domain-containing protein [Bacteroidetes bacterium]|nr:DUF5667 domain-containing protein [Bacteroidota bacterium]MCL5738039.1 DUF5667 domain-containing protein [Bacteroidota bacterium]